MTRIIFAWLLLVLAVSPFTAPFSTCDASALLRQHAPTPTSFGRASTSVVAATAANLDAYTISPVVVRIEMAKKPAVVPAVPPSYGHHSVNARAHRGPRDVSRSLHDPPQPRVLRV